MTLDTTEGIMRVNVGFVGDIRAGLGDTPNRTSLPMDVPVFVRYEGQLLRITEMLFSEETSALIMETETV